MNFMEEKEKNKKKTIVYVLNKYGDPLMPCSPTRAKKLLRQGKAKVARRDYFTIRLLYGSSNYKQDITMGVDAGYKKVGLSATTQTQEVFCGEMELRTDVVEKVSTKRELRHTRRNRKTRYRKPRFNNRKASKKQGWLPPSTRQKKDSHVNIASTLKEILPITKVNIETAPFDIQKIKNPEIKGEQYQQGEQYGFDNVREYVLYRDNHTCQHCKGKSKDEILVTHHIESRKIGGNSPSNLVTLCRTCHQNYHKGLISLNIHKPKSYRDASFMNIMRYALVDEFKKLFCNVSVTYGYITKAKRIEKGLPKSHSYDAFVIAGNLQAKESGDFYSIKCVPRHTRVLHVQKPSKQGVRRSAVAPKRLKGGFYKYDTVMFNGQVCFISGSSNGYAVLKDINGKRVEGCKTVISTKKLKLITHKHGSFIVYKTIKK